MIAHQTRLVPFAVLLVSGCGAGNHEATLKHYAGEMMESVSAVQASLASHQKKVLGETNLGRIRVLEQGHRSEMDMRMGRMMDAQDSMEACGKHMSAHSQTAAVEQLHEAQGAMGETIDSASVEMRRHLQAMEDAPDVDTALTEEHQHQTEMGQILDRMRTHEADLAHAMQAMEDDGMSMMCPMESHMHRDD